MAEERADEPSIEVDEASTRKFDSIDFATFVMSLGSNVLMQLGLHSVGGSDPHEPDTALAQQSIDILALLEQKTVGNLTGEEQKLLTAVLYQVRLAFLDVNGRGHGPTED